MIPVSSTVIPLPVYKVQYAIGVSSKDKKSPILRKPDGSLKLITGITTLIFITIKIQFNDNK